MKTGTQVALAVGAGYVLGRRRKMRLAFMLSGAAMTGALGGPAGQLLRRGTKLVGSADLLGKLSPELGEVTGLIGGELVPVGKAAAKAAVSSRINALSDRVHERAEALRNPAAGEAEPEEPEEEEEPPAQARRGAARDEEEDEEYGDEEEPHTRRGRRPAARAGQRAAANGDGEDQPARAAGRSVRAASSRGQAPVRRTRR